MIGHWIEQYSERAACRDEAKNHDPRKLPQEIWNGNPGAY